MSVSFSSKNPTSSKSMPLSSDTRQNGIVASSGLPPSSRAASAALNPKSFTGNALVYPKSTNWLSFFTRMVCCSSSRWNLGMNSKSMNICRTLWSWYSVLPSSNWPMENTMLSALPAAEPAEVDASAESLGLSETLVGGCGAALELRMVSSSSSGLTRDGSERISETRAALLTGGGARADVAVGAFGSFHAMLTNTVPRRSRDCEKRGNEPVTGMPLERGSRSTRAMPITPAPSKSVSASSKAMISIADLTIFASTSLVRFSGMSCTSSKSGLAPRPYTVSWLGSPGNW
mmetsp:Transcript_8494/g.35983  ORF Transcript_8494/g.35983 Transcript_8494/m.35983 type:complete len:289 (-) Transcript_8494:3332-4198(-)